MHFKIHRGTQEIGGSCVELWTEQTRILIDFGMPLVEEDGSEFDYNNYKNLTTEELIEKGILHDIDGIYKTDNELIDGIILSHSHKDHYGLINHLHPDLPVYLSKPTADLIEINNIFTPSNVEIQNPIYFEREKEISIGDIKITPYWMDHSAFDSYAFHIKSNGNSIFYTGDFRGHGRKSKMFKWFTHNAPKNVDYMLLEGTTIGRDSNQKFKTETAIQTELKNLFRGKDKINLIYTSGQNIDRLTSIYKACRETSKTMVVDVYIAKVMKELSKYAGTPYPSKSYGIKVIFTKYICDRLRRQNDKKLMYEFQPHKVTTKEISKSPNKYAMLVRPSMKIDLKNIDNINGGNLIYSMWKGYLQKPYTKKFINYLKKRKFKINKIHTSGHADIDTLKQMVEAIGPENIVPIHTFDGDKYKDVFDVPVIELEDGEEKTV